MYRLLLTTYYSGHQGAGVTVTLLEFPLQRSAEVAFDCLRSEETIKAFTGPHNPHRIVERLYGPVHERQGY